MGFEVGVEGGGYVGHGLVYVCSFLRFNVSGPGYREVMQSCLGKFNCVRIVCGMWYELESWIS